MSDDGCARFVRRITMPKARSRSAPRSQRFEDMPLPDELLGVLAEQGLDRAFEIQEAILPDALAGRDVLARAETGSGKTLADRKSTRLNSSHVAISYAVFCLKKKNKSTII